MNDPLRVTVTGSTGQIAYPVIFEIAKGEAFGEEQPINLTLYDVLSRQRVLEGIVFELEACSFPMVRSVTPTKDLSVAFKDAQFAVLLGSLPRRPGLSHEELLLTNAKIFKVQAEYLEKYADRNIKVLIVSNPCCSNAWVCSKYAPSIPKANFSALTRHDQFRAECQLANKLDVPRRNIKNVIVWGNHSSTQFADASRAVVWMDNREMSAQEALKDDLWLHKTFVETNRMVRTPEQGKIASALTVAKTVVQHFKDWHSGTAPGQYVSMAVCSDGSYSTPEGVFFSFPVTVKSGEWKIVEEWELDDFAKQCLKVSGEQLVKEREMVIRSLKE